MYLVGLIGTTQPRIGIRMTSGSGVGKVQSSATRKDLELRLVSVLTYMRQFLSTDCALEAGLLKYRLHCTALYCTCHHSSHTPSLRIHTHIHCGHSSTERHVTLPLEICYPCPGLCPIIDTLPPFHQDSTPYNPRDRGQQL